ncbi:alpha-mannosidase [Paenibacillus sp. LHD-117]|uniref:alpha-mannosidase n=1 Tax=Paenibacillus sp. LHD-117 TaxID=3071412 RepID=UPI0027DF323B|nr:alpha-mannosidase [Paenibacillus sp. LHD-117]MDQ6418722.1 alpha-mannosidase [Paenibacillus sp. LHD-117]
MSGIIVNTQKTAHIISHTHWDREWYLPYEKHHVRLISLVDTLLDTMAKDPGYKQFFLDGQTIILEDYLQVRPERKEELESLIRQGRIGIGPWYILQDAFLTSSEANVRNMQIGHRDAKPYGTVSKIGYFPDTFGIVGQAPQLMRQAGIDNAFFGRGVKPTGFNNTVADSEYESSFSELLWEGPDGSRVLGILFANWYSNGNEVPTDEEAARAYWTGKLADAERYASTGELLYMNGCDHQPIQTDLPLAIETAKKLFPDVDFVHSNFDDYLAAVRSSLSSELSVVKGELRSQRTDGWSTLVNTASARVYLKQMNQRGQSLLERTAEPLAAMAHLLGKPYPHHLFVYAWKTLMQNHPHDSICGCSVDEVHREMVARFDKSRHVAESIADDSLRTIVSNVDTSVFATHGEDALPVAVFNTSGWERTGVVAAELDVSRLYFRDGVPLPEINARMEAVSLDGRTLVNELGEPVACEIEDLGLQFGYDLPDDRFRQPYMSRRVKLTFQAASVPALGWRTFAWVRGTAGDAGVSEEAAPIVSGERVLDNGLLRIEIAGDGSLSVSDAASGRTYRDLLVFEDAGDIGNEYMFRQPEGEKAITTQGKPAAVTVLENNAFRASLEILHELEIPAEGDETFEREKREAVYFPERRGGRTKERTVKLAIRAVVSLERGSRGVGIDVTFDNQAKDHRVRALFPTDLAASHHYADSVFEAARRDNQPTAEWRNPSNGQHQQAFVDVSEERAGLTVANLGLNEYELLRDGRGTIAVTLLRAVGELGDWGVFPTPEAQCLGEYRFQMTLLPHDGERGRFEAYARAYQTQTEWQTAQTGIQSGRLQPRAAMLSWTGDELAFASMKIAEDSGDLMLRWFNMGARRDELRIRLPEGAAEAYVSDILERRSGEDLVIADSDGVAVRKAEPYEIVTVGVRNGRE